jgi:hypothetical protein
MTDHADGESNEVVPSPTDTDTDTIDRLRYTDDRYVGTIVDYGESECIHHTHTNI